ncbi:MAG TPA: hypothetical protein VK142_12150 [Bacillota bacterium]|nr:hypothetical protein [Bacillota bacterium]
MLYHIKRGFNQWVFFHPPLILPKQNTDPALKRTFLNAVKRPKSGPTRLLMPENGLSPINNIFFSIN